MLNGTLMICPASAPATKNVNRAKGKCMTTMTPTRAKVFRLHAGDVCAGLMSFHKHSINIASMTFGRKQPGGEAISVFNVDSPISAELLEKIKKIENILSVKLIKL